jgi:g-D-glutamyl-meso-diaminopimelate peptidase
VDLNHNYEAGFAAYKPIERALGITGPAPTRFSGAYPFSEPETEALRGAICVLEPQGVVTLHTQGREIYASPAARHAGMLLGRRIGYRVAEPEGAAAYGGLTDWLGACGVPALTVECGLGVNPLPISILPQVWQEVMPLLRHALRLLCEL